MPFLAERVLFTPVGVAAEGEVVCAAILEVDWEESGRRSAEGVVVDVDVEGGFLGEEVDMLRFFTALCEQRRSSAC